MLVKVWESCGLSAPATATWRLSAFILAPIGHVHFEAAVLPLPTMGAEQSFAVEINGAAVHTACSTQACSRRSAGCSLTTLVAFVRRPDVPALRLQDEHLEFALKHVEKFGDTDIFPVPFEFEIIREQWEALVKPDLLSRDVTTINTRPPRRILSPKPDRGYRPSLQLDPLDCLLYTALVYALGDDIEASRLAASEKIGLSHRFQRDPSSYRTRRLDASRVHRASSH